MTEPHDPTDHRFPHDDARLLIERALDEDLDDGTDVTTLATIPAEQESVSHLVARASGVVAGLPAVSLVVEAVDARLGTGSVWVDTVASDGDRVARGDHLASLRGSTRTTLVAERTILNILSRTSGVATHTRRWAEVLDGSGAMVLDTRKTTPGMRALEKYAVRCGGGTNKRMGLYDVAMVKDNHKLAAGGLTAAYDAIREAFPEVPIQVEVTTTDEALESVAAGARFLLCDNMSTELLRATVDAVRATGEQVEVEATGGLTLERGRRLCVDRGGLPLRGRADPLLAHPRHRPRPGPRRVLTRVRGLSPDPGTFTLAREEKSCGGEGPGVVRPRASSRGSRNEDAEGVAGRVGQDVERLVGVRPTVEEQLGAQLLRTCPVPLQRVDRRHGEVEVELHGDRVVGPRRARQALDPLEGEASGAVVRGEHEPVGVVGGAVVRRLVAGAVAEPEQAPVELRQPPDIGGVEDGVEQCRVVAHLGSPLCRASRSTLASPGDEV